MADTKITDLTALSSAVDADILPIVEASGPTTKKITVANLFAGRTVTASDSSFTLQDNGDATKQMQFELSGITTGNTRTLTVPDASGTLVLTGATQTLTGKTLTAPVISTISNTGTLTLPTATDTLVGRDTTDTLTNKDISSSTNTYRAASDTVVGASELATATETTTGTDATRAVTPDGLAGSDYGKRVVGIQVFDAATNTATGDGKAFFRVPAVMNGWNLVAVAACVYTAGTTNTTDIQIRNKTDAVDMLSTKITIDSAETDTLTAATAAVIDATKDDVATGDLIAIDVDAVSTTPAQGLFVSLTFQLP